MATDLIPTNGRSLTERRVASALHVAGVHETGVPVEVMPDLLPHEGPRSPAEFSDWLRERPGLGTLVGDRAMQPGASPFRDSTQERLARGSAYLRSAQRLLDVDLRPVHDLLECVGVTGSVAYGEPRAGDDCDFIAVTRPGAVWPFLTFVYVRLRLNGRDHGADEPPDWCFNYVMDSTTARADFARPRGFLFAREALTTRPLHGEAFYRGLLGAAPWLGQEAPRLYSRWGVEGLPGPPEIRPASAAVRLLNLALFPFVAAYLQLQGLRRNRHLREAGRGDECFRTVTLPNRLAVLSEKFRRLSELYAPSSALSPEA